VGEGKQCPDSELLSMHALGMLQQVEQHHVELHLTSCARCQVEVATLYDTLGALALQAPMKDPPSTLKPRVMAALDQVAPPNAIARPSNRRWATWGIGLVAAALLTAVGLETMTNRGGKPDQAIQQAVQEAKRQGALVMALEGTNEAPKAKGELYVVDTSGPVKRVIVAVEGLSQLSGTQIYCLWLVKDGKRSVGGWVTVNSSGHGGLVFETTESWDTMGITLEPDTEYLRTPYGELKPRGPKVLGLPTT
jgi:hypothetical protein